MKTVEKIFVDEFKEPSFKKCVNIKEFGKLMSQKGVNLDTKIVDNIGAMLICFGDIQYDLEQTERMPEETEEERRAAIRKKLAEEAEKAAAAEGKDDKKAKKKDEKKPKKGEEKPPEEEEKKEEEKKEPPKPVKVWLFQTSIHDLLASLEKMQDYDFMMK